MGMTIGKLISFTVHRVGFWKFECNCCSDPVRQLNPAESVTGLPSEFLPVDEPLQSLQSIRDWKDYYILRNISFDSPIAFLLSYPLTVYYIVTKMNSHRLSLDLNTRLRIHYLGPEKELGQLPMWKELSYLLPQVDLEITMIGPHVPAPMKEATVKFTKNDPFQLGSLTIDFVQGFYHEWEPLEQPDLVIACNAGLATYREWVDTLRLLHEKKIPSFFTDYSEYSCELGIMKFWNLCRISHPPEVNPFRCPEKRVNWDNNLPWAGNAFVFGMNAF